MTTEGNAETMIQDADALDLARAVARNKLVREEAKATAKNACRNLRPGDSFSIPLPGGQPAKRDTVTAVNGAAYGILGAGRYRLKTSADAVIVTRAEEAKQ